MAKKRLKLGKLLIINPELVISNHDRDDISEVVLILSIIFNHLKGSMLMHKSFIDEYEKPRVGEISDHSGEYEGLNIQYQSILISLVQEFFVFIKENKTLIQSEKFQKYIRKLPKPTQKDWEDLIDIALNKEATSKFTKFLELIRNNVGFHFNYRLNDIREGYIQNFYKDKKNEGNSNAFFSIGTTLKETRFYFGDAAIQGYITKNVPENFIDEFFKYIDKIIQAISSLITKFLTEKDFSEYKK